MPSALALLSPLTAPDDRVADVADAARLLDALGGLGTRAWLALAASAPLPDDERRLAAALDALDPCCLWSARDDVATIMCWFDPQRCLPDEHRRVVHAATERAVLALLASRRLEPACTRRLLGGFARLVVPAR